jgi:hypothetical protein
MKLELKHLAPYLPYDLQCRVWKPPHIHNNKIVKLVGLINKDCGCFTQNNYYYDEFKPILRPLSDLTEDVVIEIGIIGIDVDNVLNAVIHNDMSYMEYSVHTILVKNHFDVFGLIEKGLAIDINTL